MSVLEIVPASQFKRLSDRLTQLCAEARTVGYLDVVDWANSELSGYRSDVPTYRHVRGVPMGFNPTKGWVPLYNENRSLLRAAGSHGLRQSVSEIEGAIRSSLSGKAYVHYGAKEIGLMNAASGIHFAQMATCIDVSALENVLTRVETLANNWHDQIAARLAATVAAQEPPVPPPAA